MAYRFERMGEIISEERKNKGMTQEGFARLLGVSPQAVSKWETGAGCPDISILPMIAAALSISLDELFGQSRVAETEPAASAFPEKKGEMRLRHQYRDAACYSDLEVSKKEGPLVEFIDGSSANLLRGSIENQGNGHITIDYGDVAEMEEAAEVFLASSMDAFASDEKTASTRHDSGISYRGHFITDDPDFLKGVDALELKIRAASEIEIRRSEDGTVGWKASGATAFMKALNIDRRDDCLCFSVEPFRSGLNLMPFFSNSRGRLDIWLPMQEAKSLKLNVSGSSDCVSDIDFLESEIIISGSGDLRAKKLGATNIQISGSGDVSLEEMRDARVRISGSGDLSAEQVNGSLEMRISGSSDVNICKGELDSLELYVSGASEFQATGLDVHTAHLEFNGSCDAVIGRIRGRSEEKVGRGSSLRVLKRG